MGPHLGSMLNQKSDLWHQNVWGVWGQILKGWTKFQSCELSLGLTTGLSENRVPRPFMFQNLMLPMQIAKIAMNWGIQATIVQIQPPAGPRNHPSNWGPSARSETAPWHGEGDCTSTQPATRSTNYPSPQYEIPTYGPPNDRSSTRPGLLGHRVIPPHTLQS